MPAKRTAQSTEPASAPKRARRPRAQTGRKRTAKKAAARRSPATKGAKDPKKAKPTKPTKRAPKKPPPTPVTPDGPVWERAFVAALANTGNVRAACQAARIGRSTVYDRREASELFALAWTEAMEQAADMLEAEALRRAAHGVQEPVYYKGDVVGHVLKYSDTLLIFLLKAARPEKFRERFEHTGKDGGPIVFDARSVLAARLDAIATRDAAGEPDRGAQPAGS